MKKRIFTAITVGICSLVMMFSLAQAFDVHFHWGASTGQIDGYRIYYGNSQRGLYSNQLCEVNATTLNYKADLDENLEYYLVCRAFNERGESLNSNEAYWGSPLGIPPDFERLGKVFDE